MNASQTKVLFMGHDAALGGAQLALADIIRQSVADGLQPVVMVPTAGLFVQQLRSQGIECHTWLTQRWIFFRKPARSMLQHPYFWALASLLTLPVRLAILAVFAKIKNIRLVYSNTITVIDGALLARLLGLPHVWHLHETVAGNSDLLTPWPTRWLSQFILNSSNRVIVNSAFLCNSLFHDLPQHKIRIIHNGTDIAASYRRQKASNLPDIPDNAPVTAIIGRLNENKGIADYLKAVSLLHGRFPSAHHLIIGEGAPEYVAFLEDEASRMGLADRVHFLGYRQDIPALLSRIDVLVSTSHYESFGRTLIEAMAAAVPVVATRSGGPEEIIVDGECGFLVDVGDVVAIADRIASILADHALAERIGTAGRSRARELFDLNRTTGEIVQIIEEVLAKQQ